jgi:dTDP-4-dehydrorhamnose 3,5-epimerase
MKVKKTKLKGCLRVEYPFFLDQRGDFKKTYSGSNFEHLGIGFNCVEEFVTTSSKNVIRGMHFQIPPCDHEKMIYCLAGKVRDVVLDIRDGSETYGAFEIFELDSNCPTAIYIPKGFAHGFLSLEDNSIMLYRVSTEHNAESDLGIHWSSFGCDWGISKPIVSERDEAHEHFVNFESPFSI